MISSLLNRIAVAAVTGHWPPALVNDIRRALVAGLPAKDRRAYRNALLRKAAGLLEDSSCWARATAISEIMARQSRFQSDPVQRLLAEAQQAAPIPETTRQIFALLK